MDRKRRSNKTSMDSVLDATFTIALAIVAFIAIFVFLPDAKIAYKLFVEYADPVGFFIKLPQYVQILIGCLFVLLIIVFIGFLKDVFSGPKSDSRKLF